MLLGIDQGTTGTRACLVDAHTLTIVRQAYAAHAQHQPQAGWIEHDAGEIWACTQRVIAEVLDGVRPDGVAIANQGETVMIWDAQTGAPLHHALVWQDTRTTAETAALASTPTIEERVRRLTGLRVDPYFSAPKLRWLLDNVRRDGVRVGTLDAWLIERLTARGTFATDASTAARTLLCDVDRAVWKPWLCELFTVPIEHLPEIRDTDGGFGTCAGNGLDGVPILASIVDQPGALAGQGCIDRGDAKATFGTGCFVYANTGTTRASGADVLSTIAWRRGGASTYALDGGVLAVGSAIGWLRSLFGEFELHGATLDSEVVCVPALVGLGAPHWDRDARAAWLGMSSATTRADLAGALVDGICCRVAEVVAATERAASIEIDVLRADGGLTRSAALMQRQADVLGRPIAIAEEDEATVVGACALAALRLGTLTEDELRARKQRARVRFEPRITADHRGALRDRFARAVASVRGYRSS
jgi:glycerol kinase